MSDINSSNLEQHTTLVSIAALIIDALESYGLDYKPILEKAGIDTARTYEPSERISSKKVKRLWELSVQYSGDPCFGLTYASYIQPASLHGLGLSWVASHTLKEGLERLVRFQKIIATYIRLELMEIQEGYILYDSVSKKDDLFQFPDATRDAVIASAFKICQIMMGPDFKPISVLIEHAEPECTARFEQFFGIPVSFSASKTAIVFDKKTCEHPTSFANPELTRINDQIVVEYLNQFEQDDIVTKTREYIIDHLPSGLPKQAVIASDLYLSLRNFQRKLSNNGTSYTELLDQVRYEMACNYLKSHKYQIITIAFLLGFSDSSNFSRAFKRWNGLSPIHFREKFMQQYAV